MDALVQNGLEEFRRLTCGIGLTGGQRDSADRACVAVLEQLYKSATEPVLSDSEIEFAAERLGMMGAPQDR